MNFLLKLLSVIMCLWCIISIAIIYTMSKEKLELKSDLCVSLGANTRLSNEVYSISSVNTSEEERYVLALLWLNYDRSIEGIKNKYSLRCVIDMEKEVSDISGSTTTGGED